MATAPAALVVPAAKKHTATVIFAHGLGDSGIGWVGIGRNWRARGRFEHVKFIFPNAPQIPITVNFGMKMPGWYDITAFDDLQQKSQDETGILRSRDYFNDLIKKEVEETGVPSSRVVLGGFSQGGAISLFTGLTTTHKLAGVVGLSSYLLMGEKAKQVSENTPGGAQNKATPFLMGHGDSDPLVKPEWGKTTAELLKSWGYPVDFQVYPGLEHSASEKELDDLEAFLNKVIPPQEEPASKA